MINTKTRGKRGEKMKNKKLLISVIAKAVLAIFFVIASVRIAFM